MLQYVKTAEEISHIVKSLHYLPSGTVIRCAHGITLTVLQHSPLKVSLTYLLDGKAVTHVWTTLTGLLNLNKPINN